MTATKLDAATGNLLVGGKRIFPLGLSDPPPVDSTAPNGKSAWAEIAGAGANFARNYTVWTAAGAGEQLIALEQELEAAEQHGLQMWVALAGLDNDLSRQALLNKIVNTIKPHPGLGVWKGADEPAHGHIAAAGLVAVRKHLKTLDPDHPIAIIEAPRAPAPGPTAPDRPLTIASVKPYAAACDIHGVDIYPVSRPMGMHAEDPGQHRHQRRRRHDPNPRPRNRAQSDLDDPANRVERGSRPTTPSSSPPSHKPASWPTTRSPPAHAGSSSSAASSHRR